MQDNPFTDPATIRAAYGARGRNRRLNTARAEALGVGSSQIAPTPLSGGGGGGGSVGFQGSGGGVSVAGVVQDPSLYADPGVTYDGGTYEGSLYKQDPVDSPEYFGIV